MSPSQDEDFKRIDKICRAAVVFLIEEQDCSAGDFLHVAVHLIRQAMLIVPQKDREAATKSFLATIESDG